MTLDDIEQQPPWGLHDALLQRLSVDWTRAELLLDVRVMLTARSRCYLPLAMGMFRSVHLDLICARCGATHRTDAQFKTGNDWCEDYHVGDRVEDLPVGEEWEGIADRFCRACREDHRSERERAMAAVLAARVRNAKLVLRLAEAEAPLTAEELLARGEEQAATARQTRTLYGLTMVLTGLSFLRDEGAWLPTTSIDKPWWPNVHQALHEELRRRGWPAGDDLCREDLMVFVDEDRRICVRHVAT